MRTLASRLMPAELRRVKPPEKTADPHYFSPEHRAWREQVVARAGGRCEWRLEGALRCGRAERRMFADHIVELKDGGAPFDPANGQCLCGRHHSLKTARVRAERHRR